MERSSTSVTGKIPYNPGHFFMWNWRFEQEHCKNNRYLWFKRKTKRQKE